MKKEIKKFLEFNGKSIHFLAVDGEYWIALKPICEALGILWRHQHTKLINGEDIFGELYRDHGMVAADQRVRNMTCLPERYIYGWIFSIPYSNTMSEQTKQNLKTYKKECCDIIYEYFRGAIVGRKKLLQEKAKAQIEIIKVMNKLIPEDAFRLDQANRKLKRIAYRLRSLDAEAIVEEISLFGS